MDNKIKKLFEKIANGKRISPRVAVEKIGGKHSKLFAAAWVAKGLIQILPDWKSLSHNFGEALPQSPEECDSMVRIALVDTLSNKKMDRDNETLIAGYTAILSGLKVLLEYGLELYKALYPRYTELLAERGEQLEKEAAAKKAKKAA